jgi:hypothetical protein
LEGGEISKEFTKIIDPRINEVSKITCQKSLFFNIGKFSI